MQLQNEGGNLLSENISYTADSDDRKEHLDHVLESLGVVVWSATYPDLRLTHISPSDKNIPDVRAGQTIANTGILHRYVHPEDMYIVEAAAKQMEVEGESSAEYRIVLDNRSVRRVHEYTRIVYDADRRPVQVNGMITDIAGRQPTEHTTEESELGYRSLFNDSSAVMLIIDPKNLDIVDANTAACKYYECSHEEIIGKKIFQLNTTVSEEEIRSEMEKAYQENRNHFLLKHCLASGGVRDVAVYSGPIVIDKEILLHSIVHDITERKLADKDKSLFASIVENTPNMCVVKDLQFRIMAANSAFTMTIGRDSAAELIGKTDAEILGISENDEPVKSYRKNDLKAQGLSAGEQIECEEIIIYPNGERRFFSTRKFPIFDPEGKLIATASVSSDITRLKKAEEELRQREERLRSLVDILRLSSDTVHELLNTALAESIRLTESKIGYIYYYDEEKKEFSLNSWSEDAMKECAVTDPQTIYMLEKTGIWGEAVRQRKPVILNDFKAPNPLKKGYPEGHVELYRYMTIPVFRKDKIVAVVGVANKESDYNETDVLQLTLLMDSVWEIAERKRLKNVIEGTNVGTWEWNVQTDETIFNERCAQIAGYTLEELAPLSSRTWTDLFHPHDRKDAKAILKKHFARELEYYECELRVRHKKGGWVWVLDRGKVVQWTEDEKPLLMAGACTDITERKRAEERELHLKKILETIRKINQLIARENNPFRLIEQACRNLTETLGYFNAWIALVNEEGSLKASAISGTDDRTASIQEQLRSGILLPFMKQVLKNDDGVIVHEDWPLCPPGRCEKKVGFACRLQFKEQTYGILGVSIASHLAYEREEQDLFIEIANDLGFALHKIDVEKALAESEVRVNRKLNALLEQDGNIGELELADIINREILQPLMDDFYRLTHVALGIVDLHGNVLASSGWQDICTKFHRANPQTCAYCIESDVQLSRGVAPGTFKLYKCKNNMWDMATPLMVGDVHIGNLILGQFFFEDEEIHYDTFKLQANKYGFDEKEYLEALDKVPRWSRETVDAIMTFYTRLTHVVSTLSYSNIKLARTLNERDNLLTSLRESENRFRSYVEQAPDGIFIADEKGNYVEVNEAASKITGYPKEELLKMNLADMISPEDKESALLHFKTVVDTGNAAGDCHFLTRDGRMIICTVKAVKLSETRVLGFVHDITERRQAEEKLAEETIRRRIFFEQSNDGIVVLDQNGKVFEANRKFTDMLGHSPEEILQLHVWDWDVRWTHEELLEQMKSPRTSGSRFETRHRRKDGTLLDVESSVNVAMVNRQKMYFCVCRDINERKRVEEEMKKYKQIVSSTPDAISLVDANYRYSIVNDTYERMSGKKREELVGHTVAEYLGNEAFNTCIKHNFDRCLKGETVKYQAWFHFPEKGKRFMDVTYFPHFNKEREIAGVVANSRDITEIKLAGEALRESEERLSLAMKASEFGFWDLDLESDRFYMNPTAYAMTGYEPEELPENLEDLLLLLVHPDDKTLVFKAIEDSTGSPVKPLDIDFRVKHKSGEWTWVSVKGKTIDIDDSGRPHRLIGTLVNITPRVKAEEALLYAKVAADESNRMKDEMLKNVTHELRTPLTSVIGFSDVLLNDGEKLSESQKKYLSNIHESGHKLHNIVNKIIDFVNVEQGNLDTLELQPVDIKEVVRETCIIFSSKALKKNIAINTIVDKGLGAVVADRQKLKDILANLVDNAIKFTDSGGSVKIEAKGSNDAILFSVHDTGIGMAKEKLEKIFEPFVQIDGSTTRRYEGTGLGLALVKKLVEMHGGYIRVESEPGRGSNFVFEIPVIHDGGRQ